jgi:hypothetical protein
MTFGVRFLNSFGEVFADSDAPVFILSSTQTLTGTFFQNSTTDGPLYIYTMAPTNELIFWNLPTGGKFITKMPPLFTGNYTWLSNQPTIQVRKAKQLPSVGLPAPNGHGLVIRNSNNLITFRADTNTFVISDILSIPFRPNINQACNKEWFCIPNAFSIPYEQVSGTNYFASTGIRRNADGVTVRSPNAAPPNLTPPPFICLAAP